MDLHKSCSNMIRRSGRSLDCIQPQEGEIIHDCSAQKKNHSTLKRKALHLTSHMQGNENCIDTSKKGSNIPNKQSISLQMKTSVDALKFSEKLLSPQVKMDLKTKREIPKSIPHASRLLKWDTKGFVSSKERAALSKQKIPFSSVPKKNLSRSLKCLKKPVTSKVKQHSIYKETAKSILRLLNSRKTSTQGLVTASKFGYVSNSCQNDEKGMTPSSLSYTSGNFCSLITSKKDFLPSCQGKTSVKKIFTRSVKSLTKHKSSHHRHSVQNKKRKTLKTSRHSWSCLQNSATCLTTSVENGCSSKCFQNTSVNSKEKSVNILPHSSDLTSTEVLVTSTKDVQSKISLLKTTQKSQEKSYLLNKKVNQNTLNLHSKYVPSNNIATPFYPDRPRRSRIPPLKFWEGEHRTFRQLKNGDIILLSQTFSI